MRTYAGPRQGPDEQGRAERERRGGDRGGHATLLDRRRETVVQRQIQAWADASPRTHRLTTLQRKGNGDDGQDDDPPRPPRQLHIFVNLERIPANRVKVFLTHFIRRLREAGGRGSAMNVRPSPEGFAVEDLSTHAELRTAAPEQKGSHKNDAEATARLQGTINKEHGRYRTHLDPVDDGPGTYDEIVVIGVAMPAPERDEGGLYRAYRDVSGVGDIGGLAARLRGIVGAKLKANGHLRIQLCHAGSVQVRPGETFEQAVVPPRTDEMTVSTPGSFSIIGDAGDFVDLTTNMGVFDQNKRAVRKDLLGRMPTRRAVSATLDERETRFRSSKDRRAPGRKHIADIRYGSARTGRAMVDREGHLSFSIPTFSAVGAPPFAAPNAVAAAADAALLGTHAMVSINGTVFRVGRESSSAPWLLSPMDMRRGEPLAPPAASPGVPRLEERRPVAAAAAAAAAVATAHPLAPARDTVPHAGRDIAMDTEPRLTDAAIEAVAREKLESEPAVGRLRNAFTLESVSGDQMNCFIRCCVGDDDELVARVRQRIVARTAIKDGEMIDVSTDEGLKAIRIINEVVPLGRIHLVQGTPGELGVVLFARIRVGAGRDVHVLHLGAHFSRLQPRIAAPYDSDVFKTDFPTLKLKLD